MRSSCLRPLQSLAPLLVVALLLGGLAGPSQAAPGCAAVHATSKTLPEGIKVRPYTLQNFPTIPETQQVCVFLENVSGGPIPSGFVDHQMEEPGGTTPGPWPLVGVSSINISGGVSVTCSNVGNVGRTAPTGGTLGASAITDICCFTLEEDPSSSGCDVLPNDGDRIRHTSAAGNVVLMPLLSGSPAGGTTCGLVGLELMLALPVLHLVRRRRKERSS